MDKEKRIAEVLKIKTQLYTATQKSAANARLVSLFDEDTFTATGAYIKAQPTEYEKNNKVDEFESVITGYGLINGKLTFAYSQDFAKLNGALGSSCAQKIIALYDLAAKNGAPVISIFDSAGAKIEEGINALAGYGAILKKVASLSGVITQIAIVCGPCTGAMSLVAQTADYLIIEKKNGKLYLTSPSVVKAASKKDSGSADFALANGVAANVCDSDAACIASARELISYLPSNNLEGTVYTCEITDALDRATSYIDSISDISDFSISQVISDISDNRKFLEISNSFGQDIKCGFISLAGATIGFAACDISQNNAYTSEDACKKTARHLSYCDAFGIPFLTIVNSEGFEEKENNAGSAAKLAAAYACAEVPCVTLNLGKAYGCLYSVLGSKAIGADVVYALPFAEISIMSPEKCVNFVWHDKINGTKDPEKARNDLYEEWSVKMASPIQAAYNGHVDDIIEPSDVRKKLVAAFEMLSSKSDIVPTKKHANLPL